MNHNVPDPLKAFLALVPGRGRVLVAGCGEGHDLAAFSEAEYATEGFDVSAEKTSLAASRNPGARIWAADVRLLSVPRESYDGIWAHGLFRRLDPPSCQRALASFFAALKRGGALFVSIECPGGTGPAYGRDENGICRYPRPEFASLLRQNGFEIVAQGSPLGRPRDAGFVAHRI